MIVDVEKFNVDGTTLLSCKIRQADHPCKISICNWGEVDPKD